MDVEIVHFLDAVVHNILYQRRVYPALLFRTVKKYDAIIKQSKHPKLNEYIARALMDGVYKFIADGSLTKFVVILRESRDRDKILEKYVFDIRMDLKADFKDDILSLRAQFGDLLVRLNSMNAYLSGTQTHSKELTFSLRAHTNSFDKEDHPKWRETEDPTNDEHEDGEFEVIPLATVRIQNQFKLSAMILQQSDGKEVDGDPDPDTEMSQSCSSNPKINVFGKDSFESLFNSCSER